MDIKSKYNKLKQQNFARQQQIWNKNMNNIKHPRQALHNKINIASQLGRDNWRQTVAPPSMTRLQAMKEAGHAFTNNVSLSGKITVFLIGIGLLVFIFIGLLRA